MLQKSSDILYLFDFDGTLFGRNDWVSYRVNNRAARKDGPYLNPTQLDIRWRILTGRPKIDKLFVWYICHSRGLHPESIITYPTWFYPKQMTHEESHLHKVNVMKDILNDKNVIPDQGKYSKVFYMDNDMEAVKYINSKKQAYPIQAMTCIDFKTGNFNFML